MLEGDCKEGETRVEGAISLDCERDENAVQIEVQEEGESFAKEDEGKSCGVSDAWHDKVPKAKVLMGQFLLMTAAFGVNHGALGAAFDTATAFFGVQIGSDGAGTVMFTFAFSALLAPTYLPRIGSCRTVLTLGMLGYSICLLFWVLALIPGVATSTSASFALVLIGAVFCGIGAGMLFVSQSVYMAEISEAYAVAKTRDSSKPYAAKDARAMFGSIFASLYISLELLCKVLASVLTSSLLLYCIYFGMSLVGTLAVFFFLRQTPQEEAGLSVQAQSCDKVFSIPRLLGKSLIAFLALVFYNLTFGFAISYQSSVITGSLVVDGLGKSDVGLASSIVTIVAVVASPPLTFLSNMEAKSSHFSRKCVLPPLRAWVLAFGPVAYLIVCVLVLFLGSTRIASMGWSIIAPIEVLMGIGRAAWESTMLVAVTQWFQKDADVLTTALAARIFFNGFASGITFYGLANASIENATIGFLVFCILSIGTILAAGMRYSWKQTTKHKNEKPIEEKQNI